MDLLGSWIASEISWRMEIWKCCPKHDKSDSLLYTDLLVSAFYMQVSVGTLLAFTMVAISVLILRYVPPDEVPLLSSLQGSIDSESLEYGRSGQGSNGEKSKVKVGTSMDDDKPLLVKEDASGDYPLTAKHLFLGNCKLLTCTHFSVLCMLGILSVSYTLSTLSISGICIMEPTWDTLVQQIHLKNIQVLIFLHRFWF